MKNSSEKGSIELVVLGLLAALIVVLAIPLLTNIDQEDGSPQKPAPAIEQPKAPASSNKHP